MNLNSISKTRADRIIAAIRRNPGASSVLLRDTLGLNVDQFFAATAYVKTHCERRHGGWYVKKILEEAC